MKALKWEGREAIEHTEPVSELIKWIPRFYRVPFKLVDAGINKHLDMELIASTRYESLKVIRKLIIEYAK